MSEDYTRPSRHSSAVHCVADVRDDAEDGGAAAAGPWRRGDGDGRRPVVTDGGREVGDDESRPADVTGPPDSEEDPFLWAGNGVVVSDPSGRDALERNGDSGEALASDQPTERTGNRVGDPIDDVAVERRELPAGVDTRVRDRSVDERTDLTERLSEMERRLDRLSGIAEELNVAAINADLKHARGEDEELERVHDELQTRAERLDDDLERLEGLLEDVRGDARLRPQRRLQRPGPHPHRNRQLPPASGATDSDSVRSSEPESRDQPAVADDPALGPGGDERGGTPLTDAPRMDPVEFLIPGAKLRDMWRATVGSNRIGDHSDRERWILETSARDRADRYTFPPEVTGFTLDPDELSFGELLELADDS